MKRIEPDASDYPGVLSDVLPVDSLPVLSIVGDQELLGGKRLGLVCSKRCPGNVVLATYDAATHLAPDHWAVVGGFHSPMERQFLELLLVRRVPVVICVPRPIRGMRIPVCWRPGIEQGRILVLTTDQSTSRRFTSRMAERRNALVAALADLLFVPFATPGGSVERTLSLSAGWGRAILTVRCNVQPSLVAAGARPIEDWLAEGRAGGSAGSKLVLV